VTNSEVFRYLRNWSDDNGKGSLRGWGNLFQLDGPTIAKLLDIDVRIRGTSRPKGGTTRHRKNWDTVHIGLKVLWSRASKTVSVSHGWWWSLTVVMMLSGVGGVSVLLFMMNDDVHGSSHSFTFCIESLGLWSTMTSTRKPQLTPAIHKTTPGKRTLIIKEQLFYDQLEVTDELLRSLHEVGILLTPNQSTDNEHSVEQYTNQMVKGIFWWWWCVLL